MLPLDLSGLAGYGNQQLPAGTTVRVMAWKGLFNQTVASNSSNMLLTMQGWSKTLTPTSDDLAYNVSVPNLPVNQVTSKHHRQYTDNWHRPCNDSR